VNDRTEPPSNPPPPIISGSDRVVLHYAVLDESVGYRANHGLFFVNGKEIGKVPLLAISQDKNSPGFLLYYCGDDWSPVGIAVHNSVAEAKRRSDFIYPGSVGCWTETHYAGDDVARYLESLRCSFCGKNSSDESFAGTFEGEAGARICADCIARLYSDLFPPSSEAE
jgi:hypothetical protein